MAKTKKSATDAAILAAVTALLIGLIKSAKLAPPTSTPLHELNVFELWAIFNSEENYRRANIFNTLVKADASTTIISILKCYSRLRISTLSDAQVRFCSNLPLGNFLELTQNDFWRWTIG